MSKKLVAPIAVVAILCSISCAQPEPEPEPAPTPAPEPAPEPMEAGVDPTVADPDHYTAEFENDRVRIVRINYGPGEGTVMHYHPEGAAVFLTDAQVDMTLPDGSTSVMTATAGDASFSPAGQHQGVNTADAPLEVIQIELKGGSGAPDEGGEDPVVVDPDHYTAELENDQMRILRIAYGAGEESVNHYHPDSVAVFLTDHLVQMTMPDGSTDEISAKAGEAIFTPAGQHLPKAVSDTGWELVLVELK